MSKRQRFVIATLVLLLGIVLSRTGLGVFLQWRYRVLLFAAVAGAASILAIRDEDFSGIEWLTLPILPSFFAISSLLVFPLLPSAIGDGGDTSLFFAYALKILYLALFAIGYYATLLTANIYNVAAVRTIQLLRVAHSIGFLMATFSALLFYLCLGSLHLSAYLNLGLVMLLTAPLAFATNWSVGLEPRLEKRTVIYSLISALILGQIAWVLSFWPISLSLFAIFLAAIFYELTGIVQFLFGERLDKRLINESVLVAAGILILLIFTTSWTG